jgi:hypothetical protein
MKHWRVRHRLVFEVVVQAEDEAQALTTARAVEAACLPDAARILGTRQARMIDGGWSALPSRTEGEVEIRKGSSK